MPNEDPHTGDEIIRDSPGKAVAPADGIETKQVVAIAFGLADPQFPDQAAVGQNVIHRASKKHSRDPRSIRGDEFNWAERRHLAAQYVSRDGGTMTGLAT